MTRGVWRFFVLAATFAIVIGAWPVMNCEASTLFAVLWGGNIAILLMCILYREELRKDLSA